MAAFSPLTPPRTARGTVLRFNGCEMHVPTREFWRADQRQPVRRLVFDLMHLLIQRRPELVPLAEIARVVWGRADVRPSLVSQAIMEARQVSGDPVDRPVAFVTVRGLGYRFAATVTEGAQAPSADAGSQDAVRFEAMLADADAALAAGDAQRAQFLVDRALALATAADVNTQKSQALAAGALVAMFRGTLDDAARFATQALRLAESEDNQPVAAQARVRLARVRVVAGDLHGALGLLDAAYGLLDVPAMLQEKRRCERLISLVHRELGDAEQSLAWGERAQETGRRIDPQCQAFTERTFAVDVHLHQADALTELGKLDEAGTWYARALACNEALQPALGLAGDAVSRLCWIGNQGLALLGLGRIDDAWRMTEAMHQALQTWDEKSGPAYQRWQAAFHAQRADLLSRSRRTEEAIEEVQQALQLAEDAGLRNEVPDLLAMAVRVCERAGRFEQALQWMRRRASALSTLQSQQAATLAMVLQAELGADSLRSDLRSVREQARRLALENHALGQRVAQLERAARVDDTGFDDPLCLRSIIAQRHTDAQLRDVPYCVALLALDNHDDLADRLGAETLRALLRELFGRLSALMPESQHRVHWQRGLFVIPMEQVGERRAVALGQQLERQLNAAVWSAAPAEPGEPQPRFSVRCSDAVGDATLEEALERLRGMLGNEDGTRDGTVAHRP